VSVRLQTTVAGCLVVGAALVLGSALLLASLRRSLESNVMAAARTRAEVVAGLAHDGRLPDVLAVGAEESAVVQVLDAAGRVVAASPNLEGEPPISHLVPPPNRVVMHSAHGLPIADNGDFQVAAIGVSGPAGQLTIYAAASDQQAGRTVALVRAVLLVGLPVVLAAVGAMTWRAVGRALRPVEAIRSEVAEISGGDLTRRVPEPATDDEIARLAQTMNAMLGRLQTFTDRQRQFVTDASHDLRSPLASSRATLEVALAYPETADWTQVGRQVLDEHNRMDRLVRDLLFLARADEGAAEPVWGRVDLDEVVQNEVHAMGTRAGVAIRTDLTPVEVRGDADQLGRMVRNLLDNACRHARTHVVVELRAAEEAELVIADDGPGVPATERERIFERFRRSDASRSQESGGAGLGLAITRWIVQAHRGSVAVGDSLVGARLVVRLPVPDSTGSPQQAPAAGL